MLTCHREGWVRKGTLPDKELSKCTDSFAIPRAWLRVNDFPPPLLLCLPSHFTSLSLPPPLLISFSFSFLSGLGSWCRSHHFPSPFWKCHREERRALTPSAPDLTYIVCLLLWTLMRKCWQVVAASAFNFVTEPTPQLFKICFRIVNSNNYKLYSSITFLFNLSLKRKQESRLSMSSSYRCMVRKVLRI